MKSINENLSNFLKRRISFDVLKDELDSVIDYSVNPYTYLNGGDFVADVCDILVDNMTENFETTPKDKDSLYHYFIDTFGKYILKKYQHTMQFRNNIDENIKKVLKEYLIESDPKIGTGKKPKGSDRRLYTDENPSDTVSVKFSTKQDVIDTLNKESFKSKSHQRQSQIINLIHQRLRVSLERAKDPEVKKRLKSAFDYIVLKKEASKRKTEEMKEGLHDTSWENDEGDKITLIDLLDATKDIPVKNLSVKKLKPKLLSWDGDEEEIKKIEKADLQYPILVFVDDNGKFISIIDGHHRAQKAVRNELETIKGKVIPINSLPKNIKKVFSHMIPNEISEGEQELTERCWKGYTQKGMKTMFGKRYPNCVKKTK